MLESFTLFSGSSGNSIYIRDGKNEILIDCGVSMKRIEGALHSLDSTLENISAIFITHEHSDHVGALPMICKHMKTPIYITAPCAEAVYMSAINSGKYPEADAMRSSIQTIKAGESYEIGDILISPFSTPHDSCDSVGYVLGSEQIEKELGIATDIGHVSAQVRAALCGCGRVILESNHDVEMLKKGRYPEMLKRRILSGIGHLSNDDCAAFLPELLNSGCEEFALFHLSSDNNLPALALDTATGSFDSVGAKCGDYRLMVAGKSEVTPL